MRGRILNFSSKALPLGGGADPGGWGGGGGVGACDGGGGGHLHHPHSLVFGVVRHVRRAVE